MIAGSVDRQHRIAACRSTCLERNLFVYGTLRKACGHDMHRVLERAARFVGTATVRGALYDLGSYSGLTIADGPLDLVRGELYALDPDRMQPTLAVLDAYEACTAADPQPHEYRREVVRVTLVDGSEFTAWTYVLNRPRADLARIPDGDYVAWLGGRR